MDKTSILSFHNRLLRDTFKEALSEEDAFLVFWLLHDCQIELRGPVIKDRPNLKRGSSIAAITQRHCAEALAEFWPDRDDPRAKYIYWYRRWNGEWGSYGHAERPSATESARLEELKNQLEQHPFVLRFAPED